MKPLLGKTVVVTRSASDAEPLCARLQALGAHVIAVPSVQIELLPLEMEAAHLAALVQAAAWVACASRHGATGFAAALHRAGCGLPAHVRLAAVGPATAETMERLWQRPALIAAPATGEGLAATLLAQARPQAGTVVLPRGRRGRGVVRDALRAAGLEVAELLVYDTRLATAADGSVALPRDVDFILFTSPSTVLGFLGRQALPPRAEVVTIGPTTSAAVVGRGLPVGREAATPSVDALIDVLLLPRSEP